MIENDKVALERDNEALRAKVNDLQFVVAELEANRLENSAIVIARENALGQRIATLESEVRIHQARQEEWRELRAERDAAVADNAALVAMARKATGLHAPGCDSDETDGLDCACGARSVVWQQHPGAALLERLRLRRAEAVVEAARAIQHVDSDDPNKGMRYCPECGEAEVGHDRECSLGAFLAAYDEVAK